MPILKRRWHF